MLTDLRFALRQLAKAPGFTGVALLTLAVGIGSATVVFSAINALLFKPLPLLGDAESRLVYATQVDRARGELQLGWNYPDFEVARSRTTTLAGLWIHMDRTVIIAGEEQPARLHGTDITWDAFELLGVKPTHGRNLRAADAANGAANVALISARLWRSRFGGKPELIGTSVLLNGQSTTIVGIMPRDWLYPNITDVWTPLRVPDEKRHSRGSFSYSGHALLKPGVTLAAAEAELDGILAATGNDAPSAHPGKGVRLQPLREVAVRETRGFTLLLFGAVLFVFLIACVNVANLLLARAASRSKEFAIRMALGADRPRVVRQLLTESVLLGLLGGAGGWILALWGNDAMKAALPIELPFWLRFELDLRVFGFVFGLSLIAALLFGVIPALRISRPDVVSELKEGGRSAETSGPRALRLRNLLVVVEIALALVLLVGAGLMMRSFLEVRGIDPGFDPRGVVIFRTGFPPAMVDDERKVPARFFAELTPKLAALPGVESVGLVSWRPGKDDDGHVGGIVRADEPPPTRAADAHPTYRRTASAGYFRTVKIPLKAGRWFDDATDLPDSARIAIVDDAFAQKHYGSAAAAIGKRIAAYDELVSQNAAVPRDPFHEIVGVVGTVRHRLDRADKQPTVYIATSQYPENFLSVMLRTSGDSREIMEAARRSTASVNREIPLYDESSLREVLLRSDTVWPRRFFSYLFTGFSGVAVFLACIGIYGVMTYNVSQRMQELGVRLALGAQPHQVIDLVLRHGLRLIVYGLAAGLVAAFFLVNFLGSVLYGVSPHDPPTFAIVLVVLAVVALLACWLPSRRATLIEPNAALRAE